MAQTTPLAATEPAPGEDHPFELPTRLIPRVFWALVVASLGLNLWFASSRELTPDEAYYWAWSRHPAASYFDHPPMVAWLIRASTAVVGATELGVRLPAVLLIAAASVVLARVGTRVCGDARVGAAAGLVLVLSPAIAGLQVLMLPDSVVWFFGAVALLAAVEAVGGKTRPAGPGWWWVVFGASLGLAMLSKYTGALLGAAVAFAALLAPGCRSQLRTVWPWLGAAVATVVFSPVIAWNARHHWASFQFQFHHGEGTGPANPMLGVAAYVGGQALTWTPALAVVSASFLWREAVRWRRLSPDRLLVLLAALVPLAVFLFASVHQKVELNWPVLAYAPLAVVTVIGLWEDPGTWRRGWFRVGWRIAAAATLVFHAPELLWRCGLPHSSLERMFGWRQMAAEVARESRGDPIVCNRYQDAAELSFYLPGKPDLRAVNLGGSRPNAYDYFDAPPPLPPSPCLLVDWPSGEPERHYAQCDTRQWVCTIDGRRIMSRRFTRAGAARYGEAGSRQD